MNLHDIARSIVADGKGVLVADEGITSGSRLFQKFGIAESDETYRAYRELLARTEGIEKNLSCIVFPVDAFRTMPDATPVYDYLSEKNIFAGLAALPDGNAHSASTLNELKSLDVRSAWFLIERTPTYADSNISEHIRNAVTFAHTCHEHDIVPVIAVDVATTGPHTAGQAEDALVESLSLLGDALESSALDMKSIIVASGMAATGSDNPSRAPSSEVAERTVRALTSSLPENLAGILFLSGAQLPEEATANFNAISRTEPLPWPVAFSFSDAFEEPIIALWEGNDGNKTEAQALFLERLRLASAADAAGYSKGMEGTRLN